MKLYYFPGSCALAPHIVLEWVGADFEPVRVTKGDPEYLRINPLGLVPALEHGGRIYTQGDAILQWLARTFPDHELAGDGTPDSEYEINEWMAFLTGDLHPAFYPFFGPQRFTTSDDESRIADAKAAGQARAAHFYQHLDNHLDGRQFLVGERRSIADAYTIPMVRWGRLLDTGLAPFPAIETYLGRWETDEGVRRAMQAQGLLDAA